MAAVPLSLSDMLAGGPTAEDVAARLDNLQQPSASASPPPFKRLSAVFKASGKGVSVPALPGLPLSSAVPAGPSSARSASGGSGGLLSPRSNKQCKGSSPPPSARRQLLSPRLSRLIGGDKKSWQDCLEPGPADEIETSPRDEEDGAIVDARQRPVASPSTVQGLQFINRKEGGPIPAVLYEYVNQEDPEDKPAFVLLLCMDLSDDLTSKQSWLRVLVQLLRVDVMCFDYTDDGMSEQSCYQDAIDVFLHLCRIQANPIIVVGKGLGAGVAVNLAAEGPNPEAEAGPAPTPPCHRIVALVLLGTQQSAKREGRFRSRSVFDCRRKATKVTRPVLMVHGAVDTVLPLAAAQALFGQFPNRWHFTTVAGAGHVLDECLDDFSEVLQQLAHHLAPGKATEPRCMKPPPKEITNSPSNVVRRWLAALGLPQYTRQFLEFGFFDLTSIVGIADSDLELMGVVDEAHREKLRAAAKLISPEISEEQPPEQPVIMDG
eukprot:TRINITY_DN1783_c0_g1_i17.p1 TRINITY_DN1783_c0_g1~~TRINITY_DN1783_c0_g1_i17.p1  ORF type:complete len:490 (-),score=113.56 TRINITY_DN1783_c0_g1_i17:90-1559(-)